MGKILKSKNKALIAMSGGRDAGAGERKPCCGQQGFIVLCDVGYILRHTGNEKWFGFVEQITENYAKQLFIGGRKMVRKASKNDIKTIADLAVLMWDDCSVDKLADEFSEYGQKIRAVRNLQVIVSWEM